MAVVYCHCGFHRTLPADARRAALGSLLAAGAEFLAAVDVCWLAAVHAPALRQLLPPGSTVIGCRPRAMRWVLDAAGIDVTDFTFVDLREGPNRRLPADDRRSGQAPGEEQSSIVNRQSSIDDAEFLSMGVLRPANGAIAESVLESLDLLAESMACESDHWAAWMPVIDRSLCTSCGVCRAFCLFGVYSAEGGRVAVAHPEKCKPFCPACARICPTCAIIFPKHDQAPFDGSEVRPEHAAAQLRPDELRKSPPVDLIETLRRRQGPQK